MGIQSLKSNVAKWLGGGSIAALLLVVLPETVSSASDQWYPLNEQSLEVVKGSALDFSAMRPQTKAGANGWVKITADGQLSASQDGTPTRFLCASIVPSPPNGGFPDKPEADRWVAQLARTGYNLVRFHFVDASLMTNRKGNFDFDPVGMDRLQYLMAKLKAAGIYWMVDGLTSDNGAYGNVQPHRWINKYQLKERLFYDPAALDHWKQLVTSLWGRVNPYTGIAPLKDPAMLGMILVNEGSLAFIATMNGHYPQALEDAFGVWLMKHYKNQAAFTKSWGAEASPQDRPGKSVNIPDQIRGSDKRARDFSAFITATETSLAQVMTAHVRSSGFKGLVTSYNNWTFNAEDETRDALEWVDMHGYQSLPTGFADPGSSMPQTSIFDDAGQYGRALATARHWGKPFTVSEYGQPFWNQWRSESSAWLPALAAFQGWDAICQFAELPVLLQYDAHAGAQRQQAMYPFGIGADPIVRASERLAAVLFLRGDVAMSQDRLMLDMEGKSLFTSGNLWGQTPENLSRMALVSGIGLTPSDTTVTTTARDVHMPLDAQSAAWLQKVQNVMLKKGLMLGNNPVSEFKAKNLLLASNRSDLSGRRFETDTGQMLFDGAQKTLAIMTPRTVAFTLRSGAIKGGGIELGKLSSPATIAVTALDGNTIARSHHMLVWVLTDAMNTGMEFTADDRTTLVALGHFPVRLRGITGQMSIRQTAPAALKVWALDQTGKRVAVVATINQAGKLAFAINNIVPGFGPVIYFEIGL
jgi:hypothetical protein